MLAIFRLRDNRVPTPYRIHQILPAKRSVKGITRPAVCTLHGIIKFDCEESPHLVYNEFVALRLAQALRMPVADGVLTVATDGYAFASLEVALPGLDLPDMRKTEYRKVARRYPDAAAAILAFDHWIGNADRGGNVKATLVSEHAALFRAFDHQMALLDIEADSDKSIKRLESDDPVVKFHPFMGVVEAGRLQYWVKRIAGLSHDIIESCCVFDKPFRSVQPDTQRRLAWALQFRARRLSELIPTTAELSLW